MERYPRHSQGLGTPSVNPQLMAIWIGSFQKSEPGTTTYQLISCRLHREFVWCFPNPHTRGLPKRAFSSRDTSATYTEHMPNERTAYSNASTSQPGKQFPHRTPPQVPGVVLTFQKELPHVSWLDDIVGDRTSTLPLKDQHSKGILYIPVIGWSNRHTYCHVVVSFEH